MYLAARKRPSRALTPSPASSVYDEGLSYYLRSVALDPAYPQVREYLGEAYVIEGKFDLAKEQLATIEKICGKDCEYYGERKKALEDAHAL